MSDANELDRIEPFLGTVIDALEPRQRKALVTRLLRSLRSFNAKRIARNVEPEGGKMSPRKPRPKSAKSKSGKMFKRIGRPASLKFRATEEGGELRFANPLIEHTAAEHHFGLVGFVGKTRKGKTIRARYAARKLLGFGPEREEIAELVTKSLIV